jgi:hypothetical protein
MTMNNAAHINSPCAPGPTIETHDLSMHGPALVMNIYLFIYGEEVEAPEGS